MGIADTLKSILERAIYTQRITSANPRHTNETFAGSAEINPDQFEGQITEEIRNAVGGLEGPGSQGLKESQEKLQGLLEGNVGKFNKFTSKQFGNIKQMSLNPVGFMATMFSRQIAKVATIIGLAVLIKEIVHFVIDEAMKPGRALDRRFKRLASEEVMLFMTHQEQEKLRRGFRDVRVTTHAGLRGGMGMVNGNFFSHQPVAGTLGLPTEYFYDTRVAPKTYTSSFATDQNGNPKGGHRTGGGPGA